MALTVLIGGARSGKSSLAVRLASTAPAGTRVVVIATAQAGDEEMATRIRRHQAERPDGWHTIEEPFDLQGALTRVPPGAAVLVDCLTLWVANLLGRGDSDDDVWAAAARVAAAARERGGTTVVVTNEVGLGVVPTTPLGRRYADVLGRVNAIWAAAAARTAFVVAGRALPLVDTAYLLEEDIP